MDYQTPQFLQDMGISPMPEDNGPKSALEMMKDISPPVQEYKIKRGDTLSQIAERFGTTVKEIVRINPNIRDINKIKAGETLDIPGKPQEMSKKDNGPDLSSLLSLLQNPQSDAIEPSAPLENGAMMAGGAGVLGALMPKAITGLARAAPAALPMAGRVAPMGTNVMPYGGNMGAAKAAAQGMMQRPPMGGPQMPGPNTMAGGMPRGPMPPSMGQGGGMPPGGGAMNMQMLNEMLKSAGVR